VHVRAGDVPFTEVTGVEGKPSPPGLRVRWLSTGSEGLVVEAVAGRGYRAPAHAHACESIVYVLEGRLRINMEDGPIDLSPGDTAVQPAGAVHFGETLTDARWIEFKSTSNGDFLTADEAP
jgi:quercetin dioxygenase-like cupin family protein